MNLGYSKSKEDTIDKELIDEPISVDNYIGDKYQEEIKEEPKQEEVETPAEEDEEPSLDNSGAYNNSDIKVDHLSDEEAYSIVSNEPTKIYPVYADEYKDISLELGEYRDVIGGTFNSITSVTIDSDGRYVELIKYLKAQKVSDLFDKDVILKENNRKISGREYVKNIVIPKFRENTSAHVYTLEELNNIYLDQIVEKEKEKGNILSRIFKRK